MVWYILLAHFLADYPLQFPWILRNKRRARAVAIHVGIHLVVMLILVGSERARLWPYLAVLAGVHLFIDLGKNLTYKLRPNWVAVPYIVDQCIHYMIIFGTAAWIQAALGDIALPFDPAWAVLATSYLVVMYVWFISERILVYGVPSYQAEVQTQSWSRMLTRGGLLTLLLAATGFPTTSFLATGSLWMSAFSMNVFSASATPILPYMSGKHRWRALLTDLAVVLAIWIFIRIATG